MQFNLIDERWIPVRRRDGSSDKIAPHEVTKGFADNPVVALDAPRPDFNGALIQFLIGLVQTTAAPDDEDDWEELLASPPSPESLYERFMTVHDAFNLGGDGPRFMQDFEDFTAEYSSVDGLLIESPGIHAQELNTDHFIKRNTVIGICPCCCATALFSLQTNSPSGGPGYMTSLRGGGPLTTLVLGDGNHDSVWQLLTLNILEKTKFLNICGNINLIEKKSIFPWMGTTRKGKRKKGDQFTGECTTPEEAHPTAMFWAMPRRIRLNFKNLTLGICDICGISSSSIIASHKKAPGGASYEGWLHPLTPYYEKNATMDKLPVHAQPGGISYRHWLGLVSNDLKDKKTPARIVHEFINNRQRKDWQFRLWAFGYDMNKAKSRCWYESIIPLLYLDPRIRAQYEQNVAGMIRAAAKIGENLRIAIKNSIHGDPIFNPLTKEIKWQYKDIKKLPANEDKCRSKILHETRGMTSLIAMEAAFWQNTESQFYSSLLGLKSALESGNDINQEMKKWHNALCHEAQKLFDAYAWEGAIEDTDPKRAVYARKELDKFNHSKIVRELIGL